MNFRIYEHQAYGKEEFQYVESSYSWLIAHPTSLYLLRSHCIPEPIHILARMVCCALQAMLRSLLFANYCALLALGGVDC